MMNFVMAVFTGALGIGSILIVVFEYALLAVIIVEILKILNEVFFND